MRSCPLRANLSGSVEYWNIYSRHSRRTTDCPCRVPLRFGNGHSDEVVAPTRVPRVRIYENVPFSDHVDVVVVDAEQIRHRVSTSQSVTRFVFRFLILLTI